MGSGGNLVNNLPPVYFLASSKCLAVLTVEDKSLALNLLIFKNWYFIKKYNIRVPIKSLKSNLGATS